MCNFEIAKITYSKRSLEQRMTIAKTSLHCIFKSALSGLRQFLATESPLKMIKKCFLFHLKSSFRSQDI